MKSVFATLVLSAPLAALSGCMVDHGYLDPQQNRGFGEIGDRGDVVNDPNIHGARLTGDIGPVRAFDGPATASLADEDGYSLVTVDSRASNGTGFIMLSLDHSIRDLAAGETHLRGNNDMADPNYVQLCSDTSDGQHFDGIAEDVVVVVTERGDVRDIDIDATITDGFDGTSYDDARPTVVSSSFTLVN